MKDNVIPIDSIIRKKSISIKEAAEILNMSYSSARRKILYSGEISFFDYGGGLVKAVEEDVWKYKMNHCHIAGG